VVCYALVCEIGGGGAARINFHPLHGGDDRREPVRTDTGSGVIILIGMPGFGGGN